MDNAQDQEARRLQRQYLIAEMDNYHNQVCSFPDTASCVQLWRAEALTAWVGRSVALGEIKRKDEILGVLLDTLSWRERSLGLQQALDMLHEEENVAAAVERMRSAIADFNKAIDRTVEQKKGNPQT
jgi:hypothetical protein